MRTDHVLALNRHFDTATLPAIDLAIAEYKAEMLRLMAIREVICMALVEALRVAKSAIGSFVGPDDELGQAYIKEVSDALDAARAMGFGKEGE